MALNTTRFGIYKYNGNTSNLCKKTSTIFDIIERMFKNIYLNYAAQIVLFVKSAVTRLQNVG